MTSKSPESRSEVVRGQESSTGTANDSDSPQVLKPEYQGGQYVLAETGCGMVFHRKEEEAEAPI